MSRNFRRVLAGHAWLAAWVLVLWAVAAPWRDLGGLESEFLRWLEAAVLGGGLVTGFLLGRFARDAAIASAARTHAALARIVLYPPAAIVALALVALALEGERGPIGVVTTALLAYWAGFDLAFGAVPLMEGRPYAFARPIVERSTFSVAPETGSSPILSARAQRSAFPDGTEREAPR